MAEKKPAVNKEINKSEEVRKVAKAMLAKNEKPRPVTIIEVLKKQGITVAAPQVSIVLKKMGLRPKKRRKPAATTKVVGKPKVGGEVTLDELVAAKKAVGHFGSTDRAIEAIEALKRLTR
jgi:transposase